MENLNGRRKFNELCQAYATWIIKYCSTTFEQPLFLVWYTETDENSTDRLLTFKDGSIFATRSLSDLKVTILNEIDNLIVFANLRLWLGNHKKLEPAEFCTYDVASMMSAIGNGNLDVPVIENFTNFINLFNDFIKQDNRNSNLQVYTESEVIKKTCDYFYDFIFWPRFNDTNRFEQWDRPDLAIDTSELLDQLKDIIKSFEDHIKESGKAIC